VLQFGRWCLFAFFGVFGRREILGVLKTWRIPWRILLLHFFHTLYLWTKAFLSPVSISFSDFLILFFFAFLGVFLRILPVYLEGRLTFL
jgi:hypothetical protein